MPSRSIRVSNALRNLDGLRRTRETCFFWTPGYFQVIAARWLDVAASEGRWLYLDTGSLSILDHTVEEAVIRLWNAVSRVDEYERETI